MQGKGFEHHFNGKKYMASPVKVPIGKGTAIYR
jgi:hypothetical protein